MDLKETKLDEYIIEHNFVGSLVNRNSAWGLCMYLVAREEARHKRRDRGAWWRKGPASLMDLDRSLPRQLKYADGTLECVQSVFSLRWKCIGNLTLHWTKVRSLKFWCMKEDHIYSVLFLFPGGQIAQLWAFVKVLCFSVMLKLFS